MSLKDSDVRTPGDSAIAKKFKLSLAKVRQLVDAGAKHEKEHNTNLAKAKEVARDHIAERPDYYKMLKKAEKTPVSMKEESGVGGVRGLGYVSGDPAGTDYIQSYIDSNAMSYEDENGNKLEYNKKNHNKMHRLTFNDFNPKNIKGNKNFVNEGISAGPERESDYSIGDAGGGRTLYRASQVKEVTIPPKVKKAVATGMTLANIATLGQVAGGAAEGRGSPKRDIVAAASGLPGKVGWGATAGHYSIKGMDKVRQYIKDKKQMKEEKGPCWKGYEMVGMKKKGGRNVPNCVPVKESGQVMSRYTERPTYEDKSMGETLPKAGGVERGIYENVKGRILRSLKDKDQDPQPTPAYAKKIEQEKHDKQRKKTNRANAVHMKMYMRTGDKKWLHGMKEEVVSEDWQSVNRKDKTDGLSQKAVNAYKRENPGSKLQTAVTEKNPTGKRASRRKSFCSRMGGMKKRLTSAKTARDPDSRINKALRRWNCEESVVNEVKAETLGSYIKKASESRKKSLEGSKPDIKTWGKRQKGITTAIKKLTKEETMESKDHIQEAINSVLDENLVAMKEHFMAALQEKVMEKLDERKKDIAANYFAQD